jgi:hypothetical protein
MLIENVQRSADAVCICDGPYEGLSLETLLKLKVEKFVICLVGARRPTISIIQQLISF